MNGPWPAVPHGADLARAKRLYGEPPAGWLDLSTGINPRGWPAGTVASQLEDAVWRELPTPCADTMSAFEHYYGPGATPVPGSQAVIQALPRVWRRLKGPASVNVLAPGYGEHAARWSLEGHDVRCCVAARLDQSMAGVIIVAHPNNPTGEQFDADTLQRLSKHCELLVIDAAFSDVLPDGLALDPPANAVVLRSLGKFFGLGGLRIGAVRSPSWLHDALTAELGPWSVNGPGLPLAAMALRDVPWQRAARAWLQDQGAALDELLCRHDWPSTGTSLFRTVQTPHAAELHQALARRGVWTRRFELQQPAPYHAVRFGLPADDAGLQRLDAILKDVTKEIRR